MAIPSRLGMQKARRNQFKWAQEHKKEPQKNMKISEEEHNQRLQKLKQMGLIKENE